MLGTDVHSKGIRALAHLLRDAGIEVIYIGEHNTVQGMVRSIIVEDVDVVGLSFLSSNYLEYTEQLVEEMKENNVSDIPIMLGGIIHQEDHDVLSKMGVKGIFGPGTNVDDVLEFLHKITNKDH